MADGVDIDLYADVEEFPQDELDQESNDLYDDVLASSADIKEEKKDPSDGSSPKNSNGPSAGGSSSSASLGGHLGGRRYQLYIGNLTWWTTDQDIQDAIQSVGVSDFLEVKFYENRANGQSKGFCCVSVASEASMRICMEKLPRKEMHQQLPVVTYATKQALMQFESQSKTRPMPQQQQQQQQGNQYQRGPPPPHQRMPSPPRMMRGGQPMMMRGPPPTISPSSSYARPPPVMAGRHLPPPGMPPMGGPPPGISIPPPGHAMMVLPPPGPAPHVNPAFFPPPQGPPPVVAAAAAAAAAAYPMQMGHHIPQQGMSHSGLSEQEFEEIMGRNKIVSSSAIARAVQDAASGEFGSAIETLVTAISLIKQSKVAGDDRCRILITSLQDTLHGIENKSYGARRSRSRSRERHRASRHHREYREEDYPPRSTREHREYYRERSHDREYRRDERYYEERERYKERERGESSRSSSRALPPPPPSSSSREEAEHRGGDRGDGRGRRSSGGGDDRERGRH